MGNRHASLVQRSAKGRILLGSEDVDEPEDPMNRLMRCHQCRFPWTMHRKRYDAKERAFVRVCSEYPGRPVWSIQRCIVP